MKRNTINYYKNLRVVVSADDWAKVELARVKELYEMAINDVKEGSTARDMKSFKNDSEYKIYLIGLVECAGYQNLGIEPDFIAE